MSETGTSMGRNEAARVEKIIRRARTWRWHAVCCWTISLAVVLTAIAYAIQWGSPVNWLSTRWFVALAIVVAMLFLPLAEALYRAIVQRGSDSAEWLVALAFAEAHRAGDVTQLKLMIERHRLIVEYWAELLVDHGKRGTLRDLASEIIGRSR